MDPLSAAIGALAGVSTAAVAGLVKASTSKSEPQVRSTLSDDSRLLVEINSEVKNISRGLQTLADAVRRSTDGSLTHRSEVLGPLLSVQKSVEDLLDVFKPANPLTREMDRIDKAMKRRLEE